ncbi:headcase protein homolog [Ciona intestinalis]
MASKRCRRDSERSDVSPSNTKEQPIAGGTSSSSSLEDDDVIVRSCCFSGCLFGEESAIDENMMVKLVCNYEACPVSPFMHVDCFNQWEEGILGYLRSHGRARSWSEKQRRQNLWTKRGYDLVYRACACNCRHGHLRKDLDWVTQSQDTREDSRKKNRRKHKDLPTLGVKYGNIGLKTKSKPIPSKGNRIRHSSTGSGIDQGYISASPGTGEGGNVFSPPINRMHFSFNQSRASNFHAPSTSPLPEIPDDPSPLTPSPLIPATNPTRFTFSSTKPLDGVAESVNEAQLKEIQRLFPAPSSEQSGDIEAMTQLIDGLWKRHESIQRPPVTPVTDNDVTSLICGPSETGWFPPDPTWLEGGSTHVTNNHVLNALRHQEEIANLNQIYRAGDSQGRRTEVRVVPMRATTFAKRFDFSAFQSVLPRQHVNPYHIKMEGEGYGSDDLRNFILSSLSVAKCSQMNCVLCGVDLPLYDHFPLLDGTMFLSPLKNETSTRNCFKIKMEGKYEFVHAACIRCLEGLHNIVCRYCDTRWEGSHHQLGTLYMYDIFAANPCCQKRLSCKKCGNTVIDIRMGLKNFSDYSAQTTCPCCRATDHHFVKPVTSYQLMGIVFQ